MTVIPPSIQPPPANVRITSYSRIDQGVASTVMVIGWDPGQGAVQYEAQWRKDNGDWISAGRTGSVNIEVPNIYAGAYMARIVAINAMNVPSLPAFSPLTNMQGKTTPPPAVTFLRSTSQIMGIGLEWGFPEGALDTQRSELWYSTTSDRGTAKKLGTSPIRSMRTRWTDCMPVRRSSSGPGSLTARVTSGRGIPLALA